MSHTIVGSCPRCGEGERVPEPTEGREGVFEERMGTLHVDHNSNRITLNGLRSGVTLIPVVGHPDCYNVVLRTFGTPDVGEVERLRARCEELEGALRPFAEFARAWDAKPLLGMHDDVHTIHGGTEWAATIRLSDCRAAARALTTTPGPQTKDPKAMRDGEDATFIVADSDVRTVLHHCIAEIRALREENARLQDKALRYDLDQAGIDGRGAAAVELVELRAQVRDLRAVLATLRGTERVEGFSTYITLPDDRASYWVVEKFPCTGLGAKEQRPCVLLHPHPTESDE